MSGDAEGPIGDDARVVVVGASLAGLRTAEGLRAEGFGGPITMIGDEPEQPYDRPPLSKQVLMGLAPAEGTGLPVSPSLLIPSGSWELRRSSWTGPGGSYAWLTVPRCRTTAW